ncbi:MAG TPA: ATP-binding protein [Isosphaeraceae bacterium]|jgi:two-component system phosphate regulon sensor histidine kinase PhoR|nr:ATP-binding protein [Isosphaeraceae bacterium]
MSRGWVEAVAVVVAVAGAALAVVRRRRERQVIEELTRGIEALGSGRPVRSLRPRIAGPLGRLVRRFDEVVSRLEGRIAAAEREGQQLAAVLSGMAEGVVAVDDRRRLVFANDAAARMLGLERGAVGRLVAELIRSPGVQEAVGDTLAGPGTYRGEVVVPAREARPGSSELIMAIHGTPLPGPPPGAVLVFHDVTELRRVERMRQDFVANASHELKTPLASIKACAETLLDGALHDDRVNLRFLRQIDEQTDRLNRLILDLLSLARLESGEEVFDHAPLPLMPVLRDIIESHRGRADAKGLSYGLDPGPIDDATEVVADEEAVRQILDNLIDNAIKYTPDGGRVRVACRRDDDGHLAVEVADTGVGIPRDDLPRVFERFYRVDKARSRALGGTGLGLSIVKHLVQSVGGQVSVASRLGAGSTFTVRLPRCD